MASFFKELQDFAISRIKNTLLISFIISWSVINYNVILKLFFSQIIVEKKIEYIKELVFEFDKDLVYPLLIVIIHQFLIPYLNLLITKIKDKTINKWITEHKNNNMKEFYKGQIEVETEKLNLRYLEKKIELDLKKEEQEIDENILKLRQEQLEKTMQIESANRISLDSLDPRVFPIEDYHSADKIGKVTFDYSNNNGKYVIGNEEHLFELIFSKSSDIDIQLCSDSQSIRTISIAKDKDNINDISDASIYNSSSRVRRPKVNQIAIIQNTNNFYAAIKILSIKDDTRGAKNDEVSFEYIIQENGTPNFVH